MDIDDIFEIGRTCYRFESSTLFHFWGRLLHVLQISPWFTRSGSWLLWVELSANMYMLVVNSHSFNVTYMFLQNIRLNWAPVLNALFRWVHATAQSHKTQCLLLGKYIFHHSGNTSASVEGVCFAEAVFFMVWWWIERFWPHPKSHNLIMPCRLYTQKNGLSRQNSTKLSKFTY